MKRMRFFVFVSCLFAISARAVTYYVAPSGSDSNPGSQAQPWRTINHAAAAVSAGDTVWLAPGLYAEVVRFTGSPGTVQQPITFAGSGPGVRIQQLYQWARPYYVVTNCIIGEGHVGGWATDAIVYPRAGADGSKLLNCVVFSYVGQNQVGLNLECNSFLCQGCEFTRFSKAQIVQFAGSSNQVLNCFIHDNPSAEAAFYIWGNYNRVAGCTVSNLNEVEVSGAHPDLFQSFFAPSWGHIIESNLFVNNTCQIGSLQSADAFANPYANDPNAGGWIFRNNIFINCGSKLDVDFRDMQFLNNTFYNCNNDTSEGSVINFNWSPYGCGTNGVMVNNLFFLCGANPSSADQGWFGVDEGTNALNLVRRSMTISNNFVVGARFAAKNTNLLYGTNWINGGNPKFQYAPSSRIHKRLLTGSTYANNTTNIIGYGTSFTTELAVDDRIMLGPSWIYPWGKVVAILNDTNLWVDIPIGNGTSPKTGAAQSIIRSQDYDPMPDLRLLAGSLAIDAGANLGLVTSDFGGHARPIGSRTDIGAYEGATPEAVPTNMMLHITFNNWGGGTNALDSTTNHSDAVLFGYNANHPTPAIGPDGGAAAHIGDNQYFGVINVSQLRNLTAGTVAVWAKRDSAAGVYSYILDCGFTFPATNGWTLGNDTGNPTKLYVTDASYTRCTILTFNDYQNTDWHHYAFTWTGTNCIGYFDGLPFQTNALPASVLTLDPADWLAIGAIQHNGTPQWGDDPYPNAAWLNGNVADIRIYNTSLSASDILNVYYVAAAPQLPHPPVLLLGGSLPPQLLTHLTFQNWFGRTNAPDSTTNQADAIALGTSGPTLTTGPFGTNAAAHFATGQWLAVTKVSLFEYLTNGTLAVWIKFDNAVGSGDFYAVDGWYAWPNRYCFWLAAATGNQSAFRQLSDSGLHADSIFGDWGTRGTWHHYGVTWNGTTVSLYLDGMLQNRNPQIVPFFHVEPTAGWLALGVQHGSHTWDSPTFGWLNGSLADLRIYNFALPGPDMLRLDRGQEPVSTSLPPAPPRALRVVTTGN